MKKTFKHCLLAAMFLAPVVAGAQVTIGSGKAPEKFSVLELISNDTLGLRLPQMNNDQRKAMEITEEFKAAKTGAAMGLQIFNTSTKCVETWNGSVWISSCVMCGDVPCQYFECSGIGGVPIPQFMAYNLGADRSLDTPKEQMRYLAGKTGNYDYLDASVFGGLYQWGRAGHDYAVDAVNFRRYAGDDHSAQVIAGATYDTVTGQILTYDGTNSAAGLHIYDSNPSTFRGDWSTEQRDDLWGNGWTYNIATDGGIPYTDGKTYQGTKKTVNDPCPDGWRVPTQDEWERLGNYNCNPINVAASPVSASVGGTTPANSPFTWVPVVCSGGGCTANAAWDEGRTGTIGTYSGYAIYKKEDWTAFTDKTGDLSADSAPEPFIFLPAAGWRSHDSGAVGFVGSEGSYWSSTVASANALFLKTDKTGAIMYVGNSRAFGRSVRCVAE